MKTIMNCKTCGKQFGYMKGNREKFCSYSCHWKSMKGIHRSSETKRRISVTKHKNGHPYNWNGGWTKNTRGYTWLWNPTHPHALKNGYISEHRVVMERHLGRFLNPGELIHHKNHIRTDNRIENLELFSSHSEHLKHHWNERHQKNQEYMPHNMRQKHTNQ